VPKRDDSLLQNGQLMPLHDVCDSCHGTEVQLIFDPLSDEWLSKRCWACT
jgi:hypothetical protein